MEISTSRPHDEHLMVGKKADSLGRAMAAVVVSLWRVSVTS